MIRLIRLTIMSAVCALMAIGAMLPGMSQQATAQASDVHGTAYFYTPEGVAPTGAYYVVSTPDGTFVRDGYVGENYRVIWLTTRFPAGSEYCLSVDATALGYQPWYGCSVAQEPKLHFDVYLEPVPVTWDVAGTVSQHGNGKAVAGSTVCVVELDICGTTDGSGTFALSGIVSGTYTLSVETDGSKSLTTTVTVADGNAWIDVVQYKGRGTLGNGND